METGRRLAAHVTIHGAADSAELIFAARALIMLHELGHMKNRLLHDSNSQAAVDKNNAFVTKNCANVLDAFR